MPDELESSPEQRPQGVGWLLRPAAADELRLYISGAAADELRLYISGVEEAEALTPEVRQTLEELMNRMQEELRAVEAARTCIPLVTCRTFKGDCGALTTCGGSYT